MKDQNEWRYQYFNGWLPPGVTSPEDLVCRVYSDPEITDICCRLDRAKARVALEVRRRYPRYLLEMCKE